MLRLLFLWTFWYNLRNILLLSLVLVVNPQVDYTLHFAARQLRIALRSTSVGPTIVPLSKSFMGWWKRGGEPGYRFTRWSNGDCDQQKQTGMSIC